MSESPDASHRRLPDWLGLIISIAICFAAAGLGSTATMASLDDWYAQLNKPSWNPPNWIFGPVWTTLFLMMAIAAWLVWRKSRWIGAKRELVFFAIQLVLNVSWSVLFFGMQRPDLALACILVLWFAIAITILGFRRHSQPAAALLVPYLLWVSFASILNFMIWNLNR